MHPSLCQTASSLDLEDHPRPHLPEFSLGSAKVHYRLASSHKLSTKAVQLAVDLGLLRFCKFGRHDSWAATDSTRVNARITRLDDKPIRSACLKRNSKSAEHLTPAGCHANWPLGITDASSHILLAATPRGLLAACEMIVSLGIDASPVGLMVSGSPISPAAIPHFSGKSVLILPWSHRQHTLVRDTGMELQQTCRVRVCNLPDLAKNLGEMPRLLADTQSIWRFLEERTISTNSSPAPDPSLE